MNNSSFISIKFFIFNLFANYTLELLYQVLDAGKIYQTWPLMNGSYFPNDINFKDYKEFLEFK